jgi:succinoglycan biosynthesis protein ExoM
MDYKDPHICVCICTYRRQERLGALLSTLQDQETHGVFTYSIVVVDNDHEQSARGVVASASAKARARIIYHNEPRKNIALARNKAVENSRGDYIAFIDDDEIPCDQWLLTLHNACQQHKADGVLGPVIPLFEKEPPRWIVKGRFCERPTYATGTEVHWSKARTGNVLLRQHLFSAARHSFDPTFGIQGEDVHFFKEASRAGHLFVWCNEAPVYEMVGPSRCKRSYFIRRAFVQGNVSFQHYDRASVWQTIGILSKSILAVTVYSIFLPFSFFGGAHLPMKILIKNVHHTSRILALLNLVVVKDRGF